MKKNHICKCNVCGFKTKEKNNRCPICNNEMEVIEGNLKEINPTLPEKISNDHHKDIEMGYYCYKCRKKIKTKVCIDCNNIGSLYIDTNNNMQVIKRINRLSDVYDSNEMNTIIKELNDQDKTYIYHNYESAYRFFYKKDINKSIVCMIFAIIFYVVFLDIAFNMSEKSYLFVSYIFNMIANTVSIVLLALSVWYLFDATNVEFLNIPIKIGLITIAPNIVQLALCIVFDFNLKYMLISGFITIVISIILNIIYIIWGKIHEK